MDHRTDGKIRVVSLFSGAGGMDVGLESTGRFDITAAVEMQAPFAETLRRNRDAGRFGTARTVVKQADIATMDAHEFREELGLRVGELDLLVGGPPCQTFSTAGKRDGVQDPRGQLIWDFLRFVDALRPKVFLMENVRGLLSAALQHRKIADRPANGGPPLNPLEMPGSVYRAWVDDATKMADGRYRIDAFQVNAVNYGAPQIRERVLVFGTSIDRPVVFPPPTHGIDDPDLLPARTLRDAIGGIHEVEPVLLDFSPRKKRFLSAVPEGGNWRALPDEMARESMGRAYFATGGRSGWWRRLSWDLPSPTVTTLPNHSSTSMCHPTETRVLSVREFAAVQEFPADWTFAGTAADQMKQVGNAVPVRLGRVAGEVVAGILDNPAARATTEAPRSTLTNLSSHVRTRRWWSNGEAVLRKAS